MVHIGDPVLSPIGCTLKGLFRLPVVVTAHGLDVTFSLAPYQWIVPAMMRSLDRIVCISESTLSACVTRGIPVERCVTIHPGVSVPATLPPRNLARKWLENKANQSLDDVTVVLTVGRLVPRKGVAWFIESVMPGLEAAGAEVCYVVVGSGPDERHVRGLVAQLGMVGRVFALGQVTQEDLSQTYAAADLFVMPNMRQQGDMEGFGLVVLEARAHGLPVLASDLEGIRDAVVQGRTGTLLPPEDAEQWTESVLRFLDDQTKRERAAQLAIAEVRERHSWKDMVDSYEALFREVLNERARGLTE